MFHGTKLPLKRVYSVWIAALFYSDIEESLREIANIYYQYNYLTVSQIIGTK